MAIKHIVWQMDDVEAIVTRGFNVIGPNIAALVLNANHLVGDLLDDEIFYRTVPVTGYTVLMLAAADGSAITSGTVTGRITKDGGTQATLAGSCVHEGNGQWSVNLTTSEMDAEVVALLFSHTSAIPVFRTIETSPV